MAGPEQITNPTRELAAIMFSDIAGYTAIMGRDESEGLRARAAHRELLRTLLERFNGRMISDAGDGALSSFHSAVDAVNCARAFQASLNDDANVRVRIGIHVGDVLFSEGTVLGDGVNIASRIQALAPPGGICISERVYEDVRNKPGIAARDLGAQTLKNVERPVRVYALIADGAGATVGAAADRARLMRRLAIAAAAVAVVAVAVWLARSDMLRGLIPAASIRTAPMQGPVTLAVLPFANLSASKDDEYFSDGVTDEIRGDLTKVAGLQVTARTSSFAFKGQNEDVRKIARLLSVRNVLEGSVRRSTDRVRIEVELIDALNGFTVWSNRYDEKLADVFQIQSEVAESVAENLRVKLLAGEKSRIDARPTQNLEAYNLFLLGNYYLLQWTPSSLAKAAQTYQQAVAMDPSFAYAFAQLAYAYELLADLSAPQREIGPKARAAAERAVELDDKLSAAHGALGVALLNDWDLVNSEPQLKLAVSLNPGDAGAHEAYAEYLLFVGRYEEALSERQRERELNPLWPEVPVFIGDIYLQSRHYDRAREYYQQAIEMAPNFFGGYWGRGWLLLAEGKFEASVPDFEKAVALNDSDPTEGSLGEAYGLSGRRAKALEVLERLKEQAAHRYVTPIAFVAVYMGLGERDQAFQWLDKCYEEHSTFLLTLKVPMWDPLRSDPRFQALYRKIGLPP